MNMFDYFEEYLKKNIYPFHMPGNKRGLGYDYDFTEVEGLDNLYHPSGIIKESLEKIKSAYGTKDSFILVNGSTVGILSAITSATKKGDHILVARNCHKSVYNAVDLWSLTPHYVMPRLMCGINGEIKAEDIKRKLDENNDIKACVITSPTYEGVVSDISAIAEVCHSHNVTLIVDEAHGSHLKFSSYFPKSAVECGADLVIHSTHKTLTSLTGTGLLHNCSDRVSTAIIKKRLQTFQTSSPNYIMMASVDRCISDILDSGSELFSRYEERLENFYSRAKTLEKLSLITGHNIDRGKIVISTARANITGVELQNILREKYSIELEMANVSYALAMTSIMDSDDGFSRLINALTEIDSSLCLVHKDDFQSSLSPVMEYKVWEVEDMAREVVPLKQALDRVSAEYIYAYPPGSPVVVPGEVITEKVAENISKMLQNGVNVISESDNLPISVEVLLTHSEK